jgi:hypothetical protein
MEDGILPTESLQQPSTSGCVSSLLFAPLASERFVKIPLENVQ